MKIKIVSIQSYGGSNLVLGKVIYPKLWQKIFKIDYLSVWMPAVSSTVEICTELRRRYEELNLNHFLVGYKFDI